MATKERKLQDDGEVNAINASSSIGCLRGGAMFARYSRGARTSEPWLDAVECERERRPRPARLGLSFATLALASLLTIPCMEPCLLQEPRNPALQPEVSTSDRGAVEHPCQEAVVGICAEVLRAQ